MVAKDDPVLDVALLNKEIQMRNSQKHWRRFLFLSLSIGIALLFVCLEIRSPGTKTSAAVPLPGLSNATGTVEETVTLSAKGSDVKTWWHTFEWHEDHKYCDATSFHMYSRWEEIAGLMVVGYEHYYDKGALVLGCPEGGNMVTHGTVWFDLSSIASKAPPLHVFVKRAFLHYKMDKGCDDHQLLIAQEDWLKGYPDNTLVPGDLFARIPASCAKGSCAAADVAKVLNNWIKGADNGGYANYGFVFSGITEDDIRWPDNEACWTRFSDFSLTVTYEYDKAPAPPFSAPPAPRKNVALASNGAKATASSTNTSYPFSPSAVIDGERRGINILSGGGWVSAAPTNNDWLQVDLSGSKTINEIDVFMVQDDSLSPVEPYEGQPSTKYGLTNFAVQYRTRFGVWVDVPVAGNPVTGNMKVWRKFTFSDLTTSHIRVLVSKTPDGFSRLAEVEAWGK
jgi:F5/8 type C domain